MDLRELLDSLMEMDFIHPEDIPNIELYMDQVTTFMDDQLEGCKRHPDDKILTKTMINNYSKNHLLPPSNKKKYSKEHIILLIYIYYLKNFLSISDIKDLLTPLIQMFYQNKDAEIEFTDIYKELFRAESNHYQTLTKDLLRTMNKSKESFSNIKDDEQREFLQNLSFITILSFDIYMKKRVIEGMIDSMYSSEDKEKKKEKKKKK